MQGFPTRVGVIIHPLDPKDFRSKFYSFYWPLSILLLPVLKLLNDYQIKQIVKFCPVHKVFQTNIVHFNNANLQIVGVMCPLFPEQLVLEKDTSLGKLKKSIRLLVECKSQIITLAGFSSIVTSGGVELLEGAACPITSGNTLTAALTIEGVEKVIAEKGLIVNQLHFAIVGASGDIGSACAKYFVNKVKSLSLCSRNIEKDNTYCESIKSVSENEVLFTSDIKKAINDSDVIILATSAFGFLINPLELKKGAIVCDVSMPPNISTSVLTQQSDVFIFRGGRAKLEFYNQIKNTVWKVLFPANSIYGCLAEAIALALDEKFVSFSLGKGQITQERINLISTISKRNGITLSDINSI